MNFFFLIQETPNLLVFNLVLGLQGGVPSESCHTDARGWEVHPVGEHRISARRGGGGGGGPREAASIVAAISVPEKPGGIRLVSQRFPILIAGTHSAAGFLVSLSTNTLDTTQRNQDNTNSVDSLNQVYPLNQNCNSWLNYTRLGVHWGAATGLEKRWAKGNQWLL